MCSLVGVDSSTGLSVDEARERLATHGPNRLAAAPRVPAWRRFLRQFKDLLILILLAAAIVALLVSGELKTPAVVVVVLLNATLGFVQENRAERSLEVLQRMLVTQARTRRSGELLSLDATELVVTGTGMGTEIGRIAHLLSTTGDKTTPLQRQLDRLAKQLAVLAGIIVAAVFAIGLARGQEVGDLLLTAVALAVASIPEGLPAVTAVTLAIGVSTMAKHHAIVKRLGSVETLGCTTVVCSDKTGTLTLNQMTAREVVFQLCPYRVSGQGYDPVGTIQAAAEPGPLHLHVAMIPLALCTDAVVHVEDGEHVLIGDPTEGAMVTLATKAGIDVLEERRRHPRLAEVPFESATKLMATVHQLETSSGRPVV